MTDRVNAFIVVLERDLREEEAETLLGAIRQLRGVLSVEPNISDPTTHIAQMRARREISQQLWELLYPPKAG